MANKRGREDKGLLSAPKMMATYDDVIKRIENRRVIVMRLLTAYNASADEPNKIQDKNFELLYSRATDSMLQERQTVRYEPVTPENKLTIGENIHMLHGMIDANDSITIDDEDVKAIFQNIARSINDPENPIKKGGKKSKRNLKRNLKRNSSKRANKKKKTIKSKSKRRLRTRKY